MNTVMGIIMIITPDTAPFTENIVTELCITVMIIIIIHDTSITTNTIMIILRVHE